MIIFESRPHRDAILTRSFYTDDDGVSWFADDIHKIAPFDHGGRQAVRCFLYKCGNTQFVGYLEKYPDDVKSQLEAAPKYVWGQPKTPERAAATVDTYGAELVKKPGDPTWVKSSDPEGASITAVKCPDGKGVPNMVTP